MFYYNEKDSEIEKYQVEFNKEEIEKLKKVIINDCSIIEHKKMTSDYEPRFYDPSLIKNYEYTYVGKKEYFEETRNIYTFEYDEYKPPYLVKLIDSLLMNDSNIIDELLDYDASCENSLDEEIKKVRNEFDTVDKEDLVKTKELLNELEILLKAKKINENQKSTVSYYKKLMDLIKFDLVDVLSISDINKVESFFGIKLTNNNLSNNKIKRIK